MQKLDCNKPQRSVLDAILTVEQRQRGFSLDEPDDHTLGLLYKGKPVAYFSSSGATVAEIKAEADRIAKAN
jgi:hypothetical protein